MSDIGLQISTKETIMGSGSSKSDDEQKDQEAFNEEDYKPITNYSGEVVGYKERTESEKLRRKAEKEAVVDSDSDSSSDESESSKNDRRSRKSSLKDSFRDSRSSSSRKNRNLLKVQDLDSEVDEDERNHSRKSSRNNSAYNSYGERSTSSSRQRYRHKKYPVSKPTIVAKERFKVAPAVQKLSRAVKGYGTSEKDIIEVLGTHSSQQRVEIRQEYQLQHKKNLSKVFKSELGGNFLEVCLALIRDNLEFAVETVDVFLKKEERRVCLIGLMGRTSANGLDFIKNKYEETFKEKLQVRLKDDTKEAYREVLMALFSGNREPGKDINPDQAQQDAEELMELSSNQEKFKEFLLLLFEKRNSNQIREICEAFRQVFDKELTDVTEELFSDEQDHVAYNALLAGCDDTAYFFASCIYNSFDGIGTDDACLIRLLVARSEVDLGDIAQAYVDLYKTSLKEAIEEDTSGDYKRMLLKIIS